MNRHPDPPPWPLYRANRDRLIALVQPLSAAAVAQPVPLTPDWSIADVTAHLCGLNADIASGVRVGLGTSERTRDQVRTRANRSVAQICEEWVVHTDALREAMDDDPFFGHRIAADLTVHLQDVQHAVGVPIDRDDPATRCAAHTYGSVVTDLLRERAGISLQVKLSDGTTFTPSVGNGPCDLTVRTTPFDYLRTVTGRRSYREALALDWDGDPNQALRDFCPYGPLRDVDAGI